MHLPTLVVAAVTEYTENDVDLDVYEGGYLARVSGKVIATMNAEGTRLRARFGIGYPGREVDRAESAMRQLVRYALEVARHVERSTHG